MSTRTIEIERKYFSIEIEAKRDGTPVEAKITVDGFDEPFDCLYAVKNSEEMMREIEHQISGMDWNDHGDSAFDAWKDETARVLGVKHG